MIHIKFYQHDKNNSEVGHSSSVSYSNAIAFYLQASKSMKPFQSNFYARTIKHSN
jgi:hypothetical protein